jgi:fimbrial isopeptide formation D2 family protein
VQTSGNTNIKYTGNYDTGGTDVQFSFPTATNPFTIAKTASKSSFVQGTGAHAVTYTVTVSNPSAYASRLDSFTDVLPAGATFTGISASSGVTAANSSSVPANGATGTLVFSAIYGSSYAIAAGGSVSLIYTASIQDVAGSYQNTVQAGIGSAVVGPATRTVTVGIASLSVAKNVSVYDPSSAGLYAVPGNDVVYKIRIENTGTFAADLDSLDLVDDLPSELEFYNGDIDGAGPETGPFAFSAGASGLTCCTTSDVSYSNSASLPAIFGFTPSAGYDGRVAFIKIRPKGTLDPGEVVEVSFRARIE